jgi:ribonuclease P protein subunit POP4
MIVGPQNIVRHELIGLSVKVVESTNPSLLEISGRVVDETKNTLLIETRKGERRVPKTYSRFQFALPDGQKVLVSGFILHSQPENRMNKKIRKSRWKI